jgi:hypothetical protein
MGSKPAEVKPSLEVLYASMLAFEVLYAAMAVTNENPSKDERLSDVEAHRLNSLQAETICRRNPVTKSSRTECGAMLSLSRDD